MAASQEALWLGSQSPVARFDFGGLWVRQSGIGSSMEQIRIDAAISAFEQTALCDAERANVRRHLK